MRNNGSPQWPIGVDGYDPLESDQEDYSKRLQERASYLTGSAINVPVFSARYSDGKPATIHEATASGIEELQSELDSLVQPRSTSVITVAPRYSYGFLQVSYQGLLEILSVLNILPGFLDILLTFGRKVSEENETFGIFKRRVYEDSQDTYYNLRYVELDPNQQEWRPRKSGFYLKEYSKDCSVWLLLKPSERFSQRLGRILRTDTHHRSSFDIQLLSLNCANEGWTPYINYLERKHHELDFRTAIAKPDDRHALSFELTFRDVQKLQALTEQLLRLVNYLQINRYVIERMQESVAHEGSPGSERFKSTLTTYIHQTAEHERRVANLIQRSNCLSTVVPYTLARREEALAKKLLQRGTEYARSMKSITIITVFYLPPTFAAGFFSMVFFQDNSSGGKYVSGFHEKEIWRFFLVAGVLVVATLGIWSIGERNARKREFKEAKDEEMGMTEKS